MPNERQLTEREVSRLDSVALQIVDEDNDPELGWALRGVIDSFDHSTKTYHDVWGDEWEGHVYRYEYEAGIECDVTDLPVRVVFEYLDGDNDLYHLKQALGILMERAEDKREDL